MPSPTTPSSERPPESELLYNIAHSGNLRRRCYQWDRDSLPESRQPPGKFDGFSWQYSALELQSQVNVLQEQVKFLSDRLSHDPWLKGISKSYQSTQSVKWRLAPAREKIEVQILLQEMIAGDRAGSAGIGESYSEVLQGGLSIQPGFQIHIAMTIPELPLEF